jgi:hypothetical protein
MDFFLGGYSSPDEFFEEHDEKGKPAADDRRRETFAPPYRDWRTVGYADGEGREWRYSDSALTSSGRDLEEATGWRHSGECDLSSGECDSR